MTRPKFPASSPSSGSGAPDPSWVPTSRIDVAPAAPLAGDAGLSLRGLLKRRATEFQARHGKKARFVRASEPEAAAEDDAFAAELAQAAALFEQLVGAAMPVACAEVQASVPAAAEFPDEAATVAPASEPADAGAPGASLADAASGSEPGSQADEEMLEAVPMTPFAEASASIAQEVVAAAEASTPAMEENNLMAAKDEMPTSSSDSETAERGEPGAPASASAAEAPVALAAAVPAVATLEVNWQVLVLSGPSGAGKGSVAQRLGGRLAKAVAVKIEPLRERNYSSVVAMVVPPAGSAGGAPVVPAMWSGPSLDARDKALDLIQIYLAEGYHVIVDDVLETPADVRTYLGALAGVTVRPVSLMPSLEEMERRDKLRPAADQVGLRMHELRQAMVRQLGEVSLVLDTSTDTVDETVERLLAALAE